MPKLKEQSPRVYEVINTHPKMTEEERRIAKDQIDRDIINCMLRHQKAGTLYVNSPKAL